MIVEAAFNLGYNFVNWAFSFFVIPTFDDALYTIFNTIVSYLELGFKVLAVYVNVELFKFAMGVFLISFALFELLSLVFFVLRKLPIVGVK